MVFFVFFQVCVIVHDTIIETIRTFRRFIAFLSLPLELCKKPRLASILHQLHDAIEDDDETALMEICEQHEFDPFFLHHDVTHRGHLFRTVVNYNAIKCLLYLVHEEHVDINQSISASGKTILHHACSTNNRDLITLLVSMPDVDVDRKDCRGIRPICFLQPELPLVQLFIKANASLKKVDENLNYLQWVCRHFLDRHLCIPELIEYLIVETDIRVDGEGEGNSSQVSPLCLLMCHYNRTPYIRCIQLICLLHPNQRLVEKMLRKLFFLAVFEESDHDLAETIVFYRSFLCLDPVHFLNAKKRTPLMALCANSESSLSTVKLLLEHKSNPEAQDKYGKTPLLLATHAQNVNIVSFLIQKAKVDLFGQSKKTGKHFFQTILDFDLKECQEHPPIRTLLIEWIFCCACLFPDFSTCVSKSNQSFIRCHSLCKKCSKHDRHQTVIPKYVLHSTKYSSVVSLTKRNLFDKHLIPLIFSFVGGETGDMNQACGEVS